MIRVVLRALRSLGEVDTTVGLGRACVKLLLAGTFRSALARSLMTKVLGSGHQIQAIRKN
ncbi:MAG TPA: hypothetical protein VGL94_18060 [Ktedonobacteraceae bacterium]|jgi:hypothetical protein